jgi:spore coat protein U-like protein
MVKLVMRKSWLFILLLAVPRLADARISRATIPVSAQVVNNCAVILPSAVPLPSYSGTTVRSSASFMLKCTRGAAPVVTVHSVSSNAAGMPTLTGAGGTLLHYRIFSDAGYSTPWQPASGPTSDGATFKPYNLYVAIPAGQAAAPGPYTGTIDVTIDAGGRPARHYAVPVESQVN